MRLNEVKYYVIIILSMFIFSFWGIIANVFRYPVFELLFVVHFAGIFVGLFYSIYNKEKLHNLFRISKTTILISFTLISDIFFLILAYRQINMATAITLHYLAPLLIPVFAVLFLKEKINIKYYLPIAFLGFLGTLLISIGNVVINPLGLFYGVMSGITLALIIVLQKRNTVNNKISMLIFQYSLVQASTDLFFGLLLGQIHPVFNISLLYLFLAGLAVRTGSFMYNYALKYVEVTTASILAYLEVVLTIIYGYVIFRQVISIYDIIGIILILLAGVFVVIKKVDLEEVVEEY